MRQCKHVQLDARRQPPKQREQGRYDAIFRAAIHSTRNHERNFHRERTVAMNHDDGMVIRPCHEEDVPRLVALFAQVFGRTITAEHWRWKLGSLASPAPNVLLAMSGDRPVFQYAGIPAAFALDGRRSSAMVSVDTMTSPDFRRRGLLTRVATEAYARWRDAGVDFVFGLPNEQWGSRAAALGWVPLFDLQWLVRPLRPEAMLAHRFRKEWLRRLSPLSWLWNRVARMPHRDPALRTHTITQAGDEFDELWQSCRDNARFSMVRDRAWVQWRFLDCPSRHYQVRLASRDGKAAGYSAHYIDESNGRRRAYLAELTSRHDDPAARNALLADLHDELLAQGCEFVATQVSPGTALDRELRASGFFRGPAFSVQMVPLADNLPLEGLRQAKDWEISGATFDVI
jgi:hypothetical protein